MNDPKENRDFSRTEDFDPFPEPQTIPAGWDVSELLAAPVNVPEPASGTRPDDGLR